MSAKMACLTGRSAYQLIESGQLVGKELPRRETPFGQSEPIFLIEGEPAEFYLMPRYSPGLSRSGAYGCNSRANLYALKDLGVQVVLNWSLAGAITHNLSIGQIVLPDDVIDFTRRRPATFFDGSRLGVLRQFPVFCPTLRRCLEDVLKQMRLPCRSGGTVAVTDGPRLETPAEVRMLAAVGAELVTHSLTPEVFLARELQMCFAGACYLVNYAETGSRHRPFSTGELFREPKHDRHDQRGGLAVDSLGELLGRLAETVAKTGSVCQCDRSMDENTAAEGLGTDWRKWFQNDTGCQ